MIKTYEVFTTNHSEIHQAENVIEAIEKAGNPGDLICVQICEQFTTPVQPPQDENKSYRFPRQDKPGLDLLIMDLNDRFGSHSLDVHNLIVEVMDENNVPLEDKKIRSMLSKMAIKLVDSMSHYDF